MKILIVEDDRITRRLLQRTIESWGHEVLIAENGREALKTIQNENIKFVIADWMMPVMDGIELCRIIRSAEITGYIYFILLTGKTTQEDLIKGLDAGADDYATKPFEREEIKVRIRAGERILKLEKELLDNNNKLLTLNTKLEKLACIDPLMEIGNRRSFHEAIEKLHHRACRYEQIYGVIMCDIDNFKSYNDTYGHLQGDQVLKHVAAAVKYSLRASDDIFRYGGEEIVVLLPEQDEKSTLIVAEKIRRAVESLALENRGTEKGIITLSCGAAAFDNECEGGKWPPLLERADQALYRAKSSGKNKVSI